MPTYFLNEFRVESSVPLSADASARPSGEREGITVHRASLADLPCTLRKLRRQLVYDVGDGFLVEPHLDVAMHIDFKGETITLDAPDARLPVALAWAKHNGLGAATLTHGGLPLHGAGLEVNGRYFALMANSGTGKSTLSWFLLQNGFRFGNDDLVPVRVSGESVIAYPSVSLYPKLGRDAVDRHGLNPANLILTDYGTNEQEFYVPLPLEQRVTDPYRLNAIVVLRPVDEAGCGCGRCAEEGQECGCGNLPPLTRDEITSRRLHGDEAARTLLGNLHAVWLIGKWLDQKRLARLCSAVAERVPVYELRYQRSFAILPRIEQFLRDLK